MDDSDLAKYLSGECSHAEELEILTWAAVDPARREVLEATRRVWESARRAGEAWNTEGAWAQLQSRLDATPSSAGSNPHLVPDPARRSGRARGRPWIRWAVAALLAGVVSVGILQWGVRTPMVLVRASASHEMATASGERARVRLSDGTQVMLAPASRLEVPEEFGARTREVRLMGEAYFSVASEEERPFLVHAGGAVTRVLGTEFGVRAYSDDATVRVVVAEGSVAVRSSKSMEDATAVLRAGELGELLPGADTIVARRADVEGFLAWREGWLIFDGTPLEQAVREIERWYGVPVRIGSETLSSRRVTASFRDQPVDEVVAVIAASLGVQCTRVGGTYVFAAKAAEEDPAAA